MHKSNHIRNAKKQKESSVEFESYEGDAEEEKRW
jgi:hypothetical protein